MTRDDLFKLAKKCGWQEGKKFSGAGREQLFRELVAYLKSGPGQEAIRNAPEVRVEENNVFPLSRQKEETIARLLLEEFD